MNKDGAKGEKGLKGIVKDIDARDFGSGKCLRAIGQHQCDARRQTWDPPRANNRRRRNPPAVRFGSPSESEPYAKSCWRDSHSPQFLVPVALREADV